MSANRKLICSQSEYSLISHNNCSYEMNKLENRIIEAENKLSHFGNFKKKLNTINSLIHQIETERSQYPSNLFPKLQNEDLFDQIRKLLDIIEHGEYDRNVFLHKLGILQNTQENMEQQLAKIHKEYQQQIQLLNKTHHEEFDQMVKQKQEMIKMLQQQNELITKSKLIQAEQLLQLRQKVGELESVEIERMKQKVTDMQKEIEMIMKEKQAQSNQLEQKRQEHQQLEKRVKQGEEEKVQLKEQLQENYQKEIQYMEKEIEEYRLRFIEFQQKDKICRSSQFLRMENQYRMRMGRIVEIFSEPERTKYKEQLQQILGKQLTKHILINQPFYRLFQQYEFLANMILHGNNILGRYDTNQLPTMIVVLKEDWNRKGIQARIKQIKKVVQEKGWKSDRKSRVQLQHNIKILKEKLKKSEKEKGRLSYNRCNKQNYTLFQSSYRSNLNKSIQKVFDQRRSSLMPNLPNNEYFQFMLLQASTIQQLIESAIR